MPNTPVQAAAEGLPMFNRRRLLKGVVAGAAVSVPVVADAQNELNDEQQLVACFSSLREHLARLHPAVRTVEQDYLKMEDGGFAILLSGEVPKVEWSGPGYYEIREWRGAKSTQVLWVDQCWSDVDQCYHYRAYLCEDGRQVGDSLWFSKHSLCIVRKVEG
jgi:hypothetical protein